MARAFLLILDSFGIGGAPDADKYGDKGSNTLGNIAMFCYDQPKDIENGRPSPLKVPHLESLGLGLAAESACGQLPKGFSVDPELIGVWANAIEVSKGKDTPSGHWEIAGLPVLTDWGYFKELENSFPDTLLENIIKNSNITGTLANKHSSGTVVLDEFGEEHIRTGHPIFYTSVDSVLQIAAHEEHFGLEHLYALCETVFEFTKELNIGRVIARPFVGKEKGSFVRTGNRRDFSLKPPKDTLLDVVKNAGRDVYAIGKIADIYAHSGPTHVIKANGNEALYEVTISHMNEVGNGGLMITNFVDFDMLFGHRRDVAGYADALEKFDKYIPDFISKLRSDDLLILTADHGCDPTWAGTDHTREQVPVLCYGPNLAPGKVGTLSTFADIGASIAEHLGLAKLEAGTNFLKWKTKN